MFLKNEKILKSVTSNYNANTVCLKHFLKLNFSTITYLLFLILMVFFAISSIEWTLKLTFIKGNDYSSRDCEIWSAY